MSTPGDSFTEVLEQETATWQAGRSGGAALRLPDGAVGLALSGGGIRSATFSLGVLQALARAQALEDFDYLSTVSGGGYIGSWFSAWVSRTSLKEVQAQLAADSDPNADVRRVEPGPVEWLRRYSNYLTPRVGLLSTDALTLTSIVIRNVLLNLVIVMSFMALFVLVPRLVLPLIPWLLMHSVDLINVVAVTAFAVLPIVVCVNLLNLTSTVKWGGKLLMTTAGVALTVLLPGVVAAIAGSIAYFGQAPGAMEWRLLLHHAVIYLVVLALIWVVRSWNCRWVPRPLGAKLYRLGRDALAFIGAGTVSLTLCIGLMAAERLLYSPGAAADAHDWVRLLTFGPPGFLVTFGLGGFVFVGLVGRVYFEHSREWLSRLNAWLFVIGAAWFLVMATAFYLPPIAKWAAASLHGWIKTVAGLGWVGSLGAAVLGPRLKLLSQTARNNLLGVLNVAAFIVIVGFVAGLATLTEHVLTASLNAPSAPFTMSTLTAEPAGSPAVLALTERCKAQITQSPDTPFCAYVASDLENVGRWLDVDYRGYSAAVLETACVLLVLLIFGWRVDVNKFSLHNMYKNRLIRCYLGASNARRRPQPFTGFDETDDIALTELHKKKQRPIHIVNATLNIAQGRNLAWQQRKAASFVFTPRYCGYSLGFTQGDSTERGGTDHGSRRTRAAEQAFRNTAAYSRNDEGVLPGFTLGMAMAVSGAAASPNMGASTRPALAFVMTLLNARLGRWSANPAQDKWQRASPRFGLYCFLQELFGLSNERQNFVYLSDGGHFENLGIYELVRRRCAVIWVVDAAGDSLRKFEDLGRAIRQCRIDFGVEITIDLTALRGHSHRKPPTSAFAIGQINYPAGTGRLIYIKPSMCAARGEPADVLAYAALEKDFPQQTTADQWFDESQFESYRRLGLHIGEQCIQAVATVC